MFRDNREYEHWNLNDKFPGIFLEIYMHFRDLSLKNKSALICVLGSLLMVCVAGVALAAYEKQRYLHELQEELRVLAQLAGSRGSAALLSRDQSMGEANLSALGVKSDLVAACLYTRDHSVFAVYSRTPAETACPARPQAGGVRFSADAVEVFETVRLEQDPIGVVYVRASTARVEARAIEQTLVISVLLLAANLFALWPTLRWQRAVTHPLQRLYDTVEQVARKQDYTLRAEKHADLERLVAQRTAELERAGKLDMETTAFRLDEVFKELADMTSPKAGEKGLEIVFEHPMNLPYKLLGDPLRLNQVLINLVSNAVKFTGHGEIAVGAEVLKQEADQVRLLFSVTDSGIGMSADKLNKLFQAFSQADTSTTRHYGGTGLGLVICKRLVEMMGGEIRAESTEGEGSTFYFDACFGLVGMTTTAEGKEPEAMRLKQHLQQGSAANALERITGDGVTPPRPKKTPAQVPLPPSLPGIRVDRGLLHVAGNRKLYLKLLHQFHQKYEDVAIRLRELLGAGDIAGAQRLAHTLKGVAGNLGAEELFKIAGKMDAHLKAADPKSAGEVLQNTLTLALHTVMSGLASLPEEAKATPAPSMQALERDKISALGKQLAKLLDAGDSRAVECFQELHAAFHGDEAWHVPLSALEQQIDDFDFDEAAQTLAQLLSGI